MKRGFVAATLLAGAGAAYLWAPSVSPSGLATSPTADSPTAGVVHPWIEADAGSDSFELAPPSVASEVVPKGAVPAVETRMLPYFDTQLLVAPPDGQSLESVAQALNARVVHHVGRSGFGVIEVDQPDSASQRLTAMGARLAPHARTVGASNWRSRLSAWFGGQSRASETITPTALPETWHLDQLGIEGPGSFAQYVVAVLDTGIAYEERGSYRKATGLAGVRFVAPADFIENDGHPNDDHQHGTHIASLIASEGAMPGVAPGVSLMPVKVLDEHNQGTEWSLVEGLHHAIDEGADVINMSLSFPLGYVPSPALREAIERAHLEGMVLVAAAGNDGAKDVTWPAASRLVVAVGASESDDVSWFAHASYTNRGPAVDVLAPGGSLDRDANQDGHPDGLLAETIDRNDPSSLGYWFYEGTSQSAALVSGAVVRLLADGIAPSDVATTLQTSREEFSVLKALIDGSGTVPFDLRAARERAVASQDVFVGLLPYVVDTDYLPLPRAQVVVVDDAYQPLAGVDVVATTRSAAGHSWLTCRSDETGTCTLHAPPWNASAWSFTVDAVVIDNVAHQPSRLLFASDGAEVLLKAVEDANLEGPASVAVHWSAGRDQELDEDLAEAWAVMDTGTGLLTSPLGLVFLPSHVDGLGTVESIDLDVDGTGLLTSPLGFRPRVPLLALNQGTLVGLDGSGLLTSPLGFHASHLFARPQLALQAIDGSGLLTSPLGFRGQPILMDRARSAASLIGSALGDALLPGGGITPDGSDVSALLSGSGVVDVGLSALDEQSGTLQSSAVRLDTVTPE
ncbi:MAG: S8 family serine peptidase [Myxococcota bacterium]